MRIAEICPTCATYQDASCILYNGAYLSNIIANPGDSLDVVLESINNNLIPLTGTTVPVYTPVPQYVATHIGKLFVNTATSFLYYAKAADRDTEWERIITAPNAGVPEYSNNAAAIFAGAQIGSLYRTGDFLKIVH